VTRIGGRCLYERVGAFLGMSARSIRRALDAAPARLPDTRAQLDEARTLIAASVDRGASGVFEANLLGGGLRVIIQ